jgi:hypothetical protein
MKRKTFRNTVFLFIVGVILVSFITRPGLNDFTTYLDKTGQLKSPPSIEHSSSGLYSTFTVTYFEPVADTAAGGGSKIVAVPARKESYIGFLGRFWKQ